MPQFILPIIMAATAAAGTSASIYNSLQGPGTGSSTQPTPADLTKQAISTETANRSSATKEASQFLPMLQANTSGGLSPDAYRQLSSSFSGHADLANSPEMQAMVAKFLGLDTGASFGGSEPFGSSSGGASNPASPGLVGG